MENETQKETPKEKEVRLVCPRCKEEIDHLEYTCEIGGIFDGEFFHENPHNSGTTFICPKCGEYLTEDEEEAKEILRVKL